MMQVGQSPIFGAKSPPDFPALVVYEPKTNSSHPHSAALRSDGDEILVMETIRV